MNLKPLLFLGAAGLFLCSDCPTGIASERAGATPFPKRPFVLLNEDELATLRSDLAKSGWKAGLYHANRGFSIMGSGRGVRANADLWLKRPIEIPARGGHFHQFFCVDGDRLELPKDQRFVPGPYRCPKCGKQYSGLKFEGALRRVAHGWLAQAALYPGLGAAVEAQNQDAAER